MLGFYREADELVFSPTEHRCFAAHLTHGWRHITPSGRRTPIWVWRKPGALHVYLGRLFLQYVWVG